MRKCALDHDGHAVVSIAAGGIATLRITVTHGAGGSVWGYVELEYNGMIGWVIEEWLSGTMHHARSVTMTDCSRLITFSKRITANGGGSEVECQDGCECDGARLFIVQHRLRMRLESASCDETVGEIPDGSLFEAKLTHHLRLPSRCGAWIGYHEGSFRIVVDDTPVVEGEMRATHGFNLQLPGDDRCCDFMHSEGFMTGRTTSTKPQLDQCQLMANYRTTQEIGPSSDPCDPLSWLYWEATVAGILDCPCVE